MRDGEPWLLRGPPVCLEATLLREEAVEVLALCAAPLAPAWHCHVPTLPSSWIASTRVRRLTRESSAVRVRIRLYRRTPPGRHEGHLVVDGKQHAVVLEVERAPLIVATPSHFRFFARADGESELRITLSNEGNVPCEIPEVSAFGIFPVSGIEASIAATYRDPTATGHDRLDRFSDELAKRHGFVRMRFTEGVGEIAPGDGRTIRATLHWPDNLRPGNTYQGTWRLSSLNLLIAADTDETEHAEQPGPTPHAETPAKERRSS